MPSRLRWLLPSQFQAPAQRFLRINRLWSTWTSTWLLLIRTDWSPPPLKLLSVRSAPKERDSSRPTCESLVASLAEEPFSTMSSYKPKRPGWKKSGTEEEANEGNERRLSRARDPLDHSPPLLWPGRVTFPRSCRPLEIIRRKQPLPPSPTLSLWSPPSWKKKSSRRRRLRRKNSSGSKKEKSLSAKSSATWSAPPPPSPPCTH
jgi:hypothetical protein